MNHTWLVGSIADRRDKTPVLERINAEALSVNGDFFFFAQDRIDQGAFTGTQPLTLYCGKKAVKVTTWREVFIKTVEVLAERDAKRLLAAAKDFGNSYVALSSARMRAPFEHNSGVFIDLYLDPSGIIRNTRKLFKGCGVDLSHVGVVFAEKGTVAGTQEEIPIRDDFVAKAKQVNGLIYQYSNDRVRHQGFIGKYPVSLLVDDAEYTLDGNWRNLLVRTVETLDGIDREKLVDAVKNFSASYFAMTDEGMHCPYRHAASGVCIDKYLDPTNCVYYSRKLLQMCGVPLADVGVVYVDKNSEGGVVVRGRKNVSDDGGSSAILEGDIRENYTAGFDFSESSKRLVEERTGCVFSNAALHVLQGHMFERKDGLWFFEDQISDAGLRSEIAAQCELWLEENPIVNLTQFVDLVGGASNLEDDFDKGKYAEYAILQSDFGKGCDFNGKRGGRICFRTAVGAEASKRAFAEKVEALLRNRFDIVPVSELADLFPMVSADWLVGNLPELLPDAILEDLGNRSFAFKLLEFYYLPDDFSDVFHSISEELAAEDEVLSVTRILGALSDHYGYDFKDNFALTENVFKQIATRIDRQHRGWTGAILGGVDDGGKERLTFKQIVEKQFPRVFSHEEFYQFGATAWGWSEDHRAWHHRQLWNSFIRYDAEHWSPVAYFKQATGWDETLERKFSEMLGALLGTSPFVSLNNVSQQFMDRLPDLKLEGSPVRWTLELLASVAYFCLPHVRVINHAAAPYSVSSLLVPPDVPADADGVAYMVRVFKLRNPYAPGGDYGDMAYQGQAMKFLIENDVRQKASQKLQAEVADLLKREVI